MFGHQLKLALCLSAAALIAAQRLATRGEGSPPNARSAASNAASLISRPASAQISVSAHGGQVEHRIAADQHGQYYADVEIDGKRLHMLVDTGASSVALSHEDAASIGVFPLPADYKYPVNTANGLAYVARVKLRNMRLGGLLAQDVEAAVAERGALSSSLLGMTFLSKLSRIEVESGALVLRQ